MTPYPATLPTDAVNLIVTDIRTGAVVTDRENFAKAVWELQGFALKTAFGDPQPTGRIMQSEPPLSHEDVASHLERLLTGGPLAEVEALLLALPWRQILKWSLTVLAEAL